MITTDVALDQALAHLPEVRERLTDAHTQAWAVVDPVLLELCRLRVSSLLGAEAELAHRTPAALAGGLTQDQVDQLAQWPTSPLFDDAAKACLAFTEQFVIDVAAMDDRTAREVATHLGETGLANFANAVLVIEQRIRLTLAWEAIL